MAFPSAAAFVTLPNIVSLSRIPMAAVFPFLGGTEERLLLIAAAAITDFLDGFLARRSGHTTRLGALIDPVADRCFVLIAVATLWFESNLTLTATLVLASRDIAVIPGFLGTRFVPRLRRFAFPARAAGKVVTTLQLATLAAVYLAPDLVTACVALVAIASAVAIADYAVILWKTNHAA
jgi:CDP-diacylglycerol--glycerol-3-phosphate 3-phosphatidyltransferase/cardiolipin synthase